MSMPGWEDLINLWNQIFGSQVAGWFLIFFGILATLWLASLLLAQIIEFWKKSILPLFYNEEEKQRNIRRRQFTKTLEYILTNDWKDIIRDSDNQEILWDDKRYTDLEAEVEAEGTHYLPTIIPFYKRKYTGLKREKSLLKALKNSRERIILLEGEPGSGKSVALKHLALDLLRQAKKVHNNQVLLPVYVNLRGLKRSKEQIIDRQLIADYVKSSINTSNDPRVKEFLESEFDRRLQDGTWLFLFDSFDEIPDVLNSGEFDPTITKYVNAISDFLGVMNNCRGIVASRYFRGPGKVQWARFKILGLTLERQIKLIKNIELTAYQKQSLISQLVSAHPEIQAMTTNPFFLSMVIENAIRENEFPENGFSVFDIYIARRIEQNDNERLKIKFGLNAQEVQLVAETIAFCMTADINQLDPERNAIKLSLKRLHLAPIPNLDKHFDALEFINLGRNDAQSKTVQTFSFSHRRFQEYFATKFVIRVSDKLSARKMLSDARWRETTVVLCQTQSETALQEIIDEAGKILYNYAVEIENWLKSIKDDSEQTLPASLPWPPGLLSLLSLLQDGFANRKHLLPDYIRNNTGVVLSIAQNYGIFPDRKWALEVSGIAPDSDLIESLRPAIRDSSSLMNRVAYDQVSRLENLPEDISTWIRNSIINSPYATSGVGLNCRKAA